MKADKRGKIVNRKSKIVNVRVIHFPFISLRTTNHKLYTKLFYDRQSKKAGKFRLIPEKSPLHGVHYSATEVGKVKEKRSKNQ
jgi:hypothetical protein